MAHRLVVSANRTKNFEIVDGLYLCFAFVFVYIVCSSAHRRSVDSRVYILLIIDFHFGLLRCHQLQARD